MRLFPVLVPAAVSACLTFALPCPLRCAEPDSAAAGPAGAGHIMMMKEHLSLKLRLDSDVTGFSLTSAGDDYEIRPNARTASRISVSYRFISLSYGLYPSFIPGNNDDDLKGETSARSYALRLDHGHWIQSLSYSRVDGYYLDNTGDFRPGWTEGADRYILFPDLLYRGVGGYTAYKVDNRFSFKALESQTERQIRSAGSLLAAIHYNYYRIDDRTALTGENSSQRSDNVEVLLSLGYFHTFVPKKRFYISAGLAPGAGVIVTDLLTRLPQGDYKSRQKSPIYRLETRAGLGYDSGRLFAGGLLALSWESYDQEGSTAVVVTDRLVFQVFAGYRFEAPGFLEEITDRASRIF